MKETKNVGESSLLWQVTSAPYERGHRALRDRHERRDSHLVCPPSLPRYRCRREYFDDLVVFIMRSLLSSWPALANVELGVEDVPPSDPAPWEHYSVALGRTFAADAKAGLPPRIVIYRRPCEQRVNEEIDLYTLVRSVVLEQCAQLLGRRSDEL